jgi:hypothetical protein
MPLAGARGQGVVPANATTSARPGEAAFDVAARPATTDAQISELVEFARARVTFSAEQSAADGTTSYSLRASFIYLQIASGNRRNAGEQPPANAAPLAEADVSGDDSSSTGQAIPVLSAPAAVPLASPVDASESVLRAYEHVLINATSRSVHADTRRGEASSSSTTPIPASAGAVSGRTAKTPAVTDAAAAAELPARAVQRMSPQEYAATMSRLQTRAVERRTETALSLELRTREGDAVSLDFRQVELLSRMRLHGVADNGDQMSVRGDDLSLQRAVQMNVEGDLSTTELDAINSLIDKVVDVANAFFGGDLRSAWDRVQSLEFDAATLSEFSLHLSVAQSQSVTRTYQGEDQGEESLSALTARDRDARSVLDRLGREQRSLIESARQHFDDTSAVVFVRELLPRLLPSQVELRPITEPVMVSGEGSASAPS